MACEIVSCTGALFVLWGRPTRDAIDAAVTELRLTAERAGRPVTYITRVPQDAPAPDADARRHLDKLMPKILEWCSTYHVVLEGGGFMNAMKRGVLTSLFQIRWRRGTFFVHSTVGEVIHCVSRERKVEVAHVLELAEQRELLTKLVADTTPPSRDELRSAFRSAAR